ncbi:hypothetical protein GGI05_006222, partial [Coemansia sp. RSA 2603]
LSPDRMRRLCEESQWERVLRTGEMPHMRKSRADPLERDGSLVRDASLLDLCYDHLVRTEEGLDQRARERQAESRQSETQPENQPDTDHENQPEPNQPNSP